MKRIIISLFIVIVSFNVLASTAIVDGVTWYYNRYYNYDIDEYEVEITYMNTYSYGTYKGNLTIPSELDGKKVRRIGEYAFRNCNTLYSLTIPEGVTTIKRYAFMSSTALQSISFPSSIKDIAPNAFDDTPFYKNLPDGIAVFGGCLYKNIGNSIVDVVVPKGVLSIAENAFKNAKSLRTVSLPEGLLEISDLAFYGCSSLVSVSMPSSVKSIGMAAFSGCTNLSDIKIPAGMVSLGRESFSSCKSLASIDIPEGIEEIPDQAFYQCSTLENITLPNSLKAIGIFAFDGCKKLSSLQIPNGVTSIGDCAFSSSGIETIALPDSVMTLGGSAFSNCSKLQEIRLSQSLRLINMSTFSGCKNLKSIVIPEGVIHICSMAFDGCAMLESVDFPTTLRVVEEMAFCGCRSLRAVDMPDGVVEIGKGAFSNCFSLTNVTLGDGLLHIGPDCFYWCFGINAISIPEGVTTLEGYTFAGCSGLKEVHIPSTMRYVNITAFDDCQNIEKVTMPGDFSAFATTQSEYGLCYIMYERYVDNIDYFSADIQYRADDYGGLWWSMNNEFYKVDLQEPIAQVFPSHKIISSLTVLPLVGGNGYYDYSSNIVHTGYANGLPLLKEVELKSGIVEVGPNAFSGCIMLETIKFAEGVQKINGYAFSGCKKLRNANLPNSLREIGESTFLDCAQLKVCDLPVSLNNVGSQAFSGCVVSEIIALPKDLHHIGNDAFGRCADLKSVVALGSVPSGLDSSGLLKEGVMFYYTQEYGAEWQKVVPLDNAVGLYHGERGAVSVTSFLPREGDASILEAKYVVNSKKPSVKVRVLAFEDGVHSFAKVIRPATFVDGSETGVGDDIAPGEERMLAWQVASDWATKLSKVDFEVMALEGGLLPLETIQIPANGDHKAVVVSWNKMQDGQVLDALYWLYADSDSGLSLENGVLKRNDTGTILVEGETIVNPHAAVDYVYAKMGYETLSGEVLDYVRDATDLNLNPNGIRQYAYKVVE